MGNGIPSGAIGASAAVLIYSLICLFLVTSFICMLWTYNQRCTYVSLLALFSTISTLGSIIQQIHYNYAWSIIKYDKYKKAVSNIDTPALGFWGVGNNMDFALFLIQFYCYNVMALCTFFWAAALFAGSWEIRFNFLGSARDYCGLVSKIFAIIWPGLLIGAANAPIVLENYVLSFILINVTIIVCITIGSILMVLILVKYVKTRRVLFSHEKRNAWWGSTGTMTEPTNPSSTVVTNTATIRASRRAIYDRALIIRFSTGFVIIVVFEVILIFFSIFSAHNFQVLGTASGPDLSLGGCITDILLFMPGVTTSLLVFVVFGTTKSFKQYSELFLSVCGKRRPLSRGRKRGVMGSRQSEGPQGTEFQRLPSPGISPKHMSVEERVKFEAKSRGQIPFDQQLIGTTLITAGNLKEPESQISYDDLSPMSPNFPISYRQNGRPSVIYEEQGPGKSWAGQSDLEIALAVEHGWEGEHNGQFTHDGRCGRFRPCLGRGLGLGKRTPSREETDGEFYYEHYDTSWERCAKKSCLY